MLTSLFKPAWKSSSVEKRLSAIAAMNGDSLDHQEVLVQLVDDSDQSVCVAAIRKLGSIDTLLELSARHSADAIRSEFVQRIDELLCNDCKLNEEQYRGLLSRFPELAQRLAVHATVASIRQQAIQQLQPQQLVQVLEVTSYTDARQLIAEKLSSIEELESARKLLRGKDKNAERILKTKIDEIRTIERIQAENRATVERLIEEAEYLCSHDWLPEFKTRFQAHRSLWDKLDFEIEANSKLRYQKARDIIDARFQEQRIVEQILQSRQQLQDEITASLQSVTNMTLGEAIRAQNEIVAMQGLFKSRWNELGEKLAADEGAQKHYQKIMQALQSATQLVAQAAEIMQAEAPDANADNNGHTSQQTLNRRIGLTTTLIKQHKWPAGLSRLKSAQELQQLLDDWVKEKQTAEAEQEQKLARLHKKISSIFRFSRMGNLARAKQTLERAEKALAHFTGKEHAKLQERLEEARKTMSEMGDWKNFATEPKYVELCKSMEALQGSKLHPEKLAKKIRDLQQRWKTLGHSDISDQYWSRFKDTADSVYQPCAEFFEQRHQTRKANLEKRQQSVEQMRELLESTEWENDPDYKLAQTEVRKISDHFFAIKDVEHGPGQKQWKTFSKLKDQVYAKLDIAYEANIELKKQLVQQAAALAEAEAKEENLVKLKTLQTRWKNIGITKRNADQKAWKEFKKQGDIVFSNVQALRKGHRDEVDQQLNTYREIIKKIHKLAKSASDLSQSDQQFSELQAQYAELPELPENLPEKLLKGIQQDYRRACDEFDNSHSRILSNMHDQQIDALRRRAELCAQLEALGEAADDETLEKISHQWDTIELKDAQLSKRIQARKDAAQQPIDRDDIGAQRRMLCIKLEIATGKESPAEDKALRMQYQLEQMNKSGLGQQAVNSKDQLEQMEIDWLCMPGAEHALQKILDMRFRQALKPR